MNYSAVTYLQDTSHNHGRSSSSGEDFQQEDPSFFSTGRVFQIKAPGNSTLDGKVWVVVINRNTAGQCLPIDCYEHDALSGIFLENNARLHDSQDRHGKTDGELKPLTITLSKSHRLNPNCWVNMQRSFYIEFTHTVANIGKLDHKSTERLREYHKECYW